MLWRAATTLVFGLATAVGSMARADECFCLVHLQTAAVLRGCEAFSQNQIAACTDPDTGKKAIQTISSDWQRINEGADRCDPCKRAALGTTAHEPPRGDLVMM